jgi:hypothetical protein
MDAPLLRHPSPPMGHDSGGLPDLGPSSSELLERYLDGMLTERERRVFENSLESDPVLRQHLSLQRHIDARLRVHAALPTTLAAGALGDETGPSPEAVSASSTPVPIAPGSMVSRPPARRIHWLRVAALVALVMSGYLLYLNVGPSPQPTATVRPFLTPMEVYVAEVGQGMTPDVVCVSNEAFLTFAKDTVGIALSIQPTQGLTLIGWNYASRVFSDNTVALLAKYHDQPVVIFMDRIEPGLMDGCAGNSTCDEAAVRVGGVYLHEVRPKGTPSILDKFVGPR